MHEIHACSVMRFIDVCSVMILLNTWYWSRMHIVHTVNCCCMVHLSSIYGTCQRLILHPKTAVDQCRIIAIISTNDACSSCHHSMIHTLPVIDLCTLLRCDTVLYGDHWYGDHRYGDMGTIDIILYQHIVTARASYAFGLKHNMCLFWEDIIHVIM